MLLAEAAGTKEQLLAEAAGSREKGMAEVNVKEAEAGAIEKRGLAEATAGPAYATSAGLIAYAMTDDHDVEAPSLEEEFVESPQPDGLVGRLGGWFREHF